MNQPLSARFGHAADPSQSVQVFVDASGSRRRVLRSMGLVLSGVVLLFLVALADPLFTPHASGPSSPPVSPVSPVSVVPAEGTM